MGRLIFFEMFWHLSLVSRFAYTVGGGSCSDQYRDLDLHYQSPETIEADQTVIRLFSQAYLWV